MNKDSNPYNVGDTLIGTVTGGVDLTQGNEYVCLAVSGCKVVVLDDKKRKNLYFESRFKLK